MQVIVRSLLLFTLCCVSSACTTGSMPDAAPADGSQGGDEPETEDQKTLNALGQALAQNIGGAGLSPEELAFVQRGLSDAALGREPLVELTEYGPKIQAFMQGRAETAAEGELAHATAFMEEQAGVEGAERTESGIVVQETLAGTGANPTAEDTVQVHCRVGGGAHRRARLRPPLKRYVRFSRIPLSQGCPGAERWKVLTSGPSALLWD